MYIVFDIGGTKTRIATSLDGRTLSEVRTCETPRQYADGVRLIIQNIIDMAPDCARVTHIAGCIRGRLDAQHTGIASDDILADWQGKPLARDLSLACSIPVLLENDAALAALGEAHYGAGKGYAIVAYHTISTGVGGARIVDGVIDERSSGFEPGHQSIDVDRTLCPDCETGMLEDYISGTSVEHRFGRKPYEIPQGDSLWDELAHWLAHGLNNTIAYWSPDIIVLGGSMMVGDPRIPLAGVAQHLARIAAATGTPIPELAAASLHDHAGLYGALALVKLTTGQE